MAERLYSGATPEKVAADLAPLVDFQDDGLHIADLNLLVEERLLPHLMRYDLPTCQGLFNASLELGASYGAEVALEWNQGVTNWQASPGGATLEELCCQALCGLFDLAPTSAATMLYCGGYGNQQAVYMALHHWARAAGFDLTQQGLAGCSDPSRLAILVSKDAHFSFHHAVRLLGLGEEALVHVPTDEARRMDPDGLRDTLRSLEGDRDVFCVGATAGTTATGAVDPVADLAQVCAERDLWLHVDGSYGLGYALVPEKKPLFRGVAEAHTLTWDPHKQLAVPIPTSVLFAREAAFFEPMAVFSGYWNRPESNVPNPGLKSVPGTRPFSALPLVTSLRHQGLRQVADRLRKPLQAMRGFYEVLQDHPDVEPLHEPDTGVLCFRVRQRALSEEDVDRMQEQIYRTPQRKGKRMLSMTRLQGKAVLRAVAVSPDVTTDALLYTIQEALQIAGSLR